MQLLTLQEELYTNIIADGRYLLYLEGLRNTLFMALGGVIIGTVIGVLIAIIKVYAAENKGLAPLNWLANVYIGLIRGTPVVVQLMIFYYVVFASADDTWAIPVAMLSFGINSGAYVAEIIRAGILSVDRGQTEAGRSLGLSQNVTMRYIVLPQAVKNILPALFNEFIALVKETSVAPMIAVRELTMVSTVIKSRTFNAYVPLLAVAAIYLVIVLGLTALQKKMEGRLRVSDQR
ncbi:MAG TPA: amino acid ABC transporter permease [Firmicutes bacterium]|nr:amino acid ABC transporter permease [Bacillota bacterium]